MTTKQLSAVWYLYDDGSREYDVCYVPLIRESLWGRFCKYLAEKVKR